MTSRKVKRYLSSTKQAITKKRIAKTVRKNPPQQRRRTNPLPPQEPIADDDPPKELPRFYKSPAHLLRDGDKIEVWWEGDEKFYPARARNLRGDGRRRVEYDDGQVMYHDLSRELFILSGQALETFLADKFPNAVKRHSGGHPVLFPGLAPFVTVGDTVEIYWKDYKAYYPGFVTGQGVDGWYSISYDDGDREPVRFIVLIDMSVKGNESRFCTRSG